MLARPATHRRRSFAPWRLRNGAGFVFMASRPKAHRIKASTANKAMLASTRLPVRSSAAFPALAGRRIRAHRAGLQGDRDSIAGMMVSWTPSLLLLAWLLSDLPTVESEDQPNSLRC